MTQSHRLPVGGRIDRTRTLRFRFDGREYEGHPGDTLASALLANGVSLVARSFKYHRPRGFFAAGVEDPSALVQLETGAVTEPNRRAACLAPLFPAGFYYKTFMRPAALWRSLWEPLLRRMAGLGRAPELPDPSRYDKTHTHCDVLVVGAGSAGLAAALAAGRTGARVILADGDSEFGGTLLRRDDRVGDQQGAAWSPRCRLSDCCRTPPCSAATTTIT